MSISLHNAFEVDFPDLETTYNTLAAFRARLETIGHNENIALHSREAVTCIDRLAIFGSKSGEKYSGQETPFLYARNLIDQRRHKIKSDGYRDPHVDFDFTLTIFPIDNRILGMAHTERNSWFDLLCEIPGIRHTPWWNNTDPPDQITENEWQDRENIWRRIFRRDPVGRPSHCGFSLDMSPFLKSPKVEELVSAQEDFQTRLKRIAQEYLFHKALTGLEDANPTQVIRKIGQTETFLRTDQGQDALKTHMKNCRPLMKETLEDKDFLGKISLPPSDMPPLST